MDFYLACVTLLQLLGYDGYDMNHFILPFLLHFFQANAKEKTFTIPKKTVFDLFEWNRIVGNGTHTPNASAQLTKPSRERAMFTFCCK